MARKKKIVEEKKVPHVNCPFCHSPMGIVESIDYAPDGSEVSRRFYYDCSSCDDLQKQQLGK